MDLKSANLELHIDQLLLDGFEWIDREVVGMTFRQEFERLVLEHGVPAGFRQGEGLANVANNPMQLTPGNDGQLVGAALAKVIYGDGNS